MNIKVLPNGALKLTANNATRAYIADRQRAGRMSDDILYDLTESYWTNGSYQPFDSGNANPFVGLTSAPCIAECMDTHDDGTNEIVGRFWYFADYMLEDPMETLKCRGAVEFQAP